MPANSLQHNGGSIVATGTTVQATLTHSALPEDPGHKVDGVRPTVVSARGQGDTVTIEWSEALTETAPSGAGGFGLSALRGSAPRVRSVSIDDRVVTLGLDGAIALNEDYTLAYAMPSTHPIRDAAGNEAEGFSMGMEKSVETIALSFTLTSAVTDGGGNPVVVEGGAGVTLEAVLTGGTFDSAQTIDLSWEAPAGGNLVGTLLLGAGGATAMTIPAGATSATLALSARQDSRYLPGFTGAFELRRGGERLESWNLTWRDDELAPRASLEVQTTEIDEGQPIVLTVSLSGVYSTVAGVPTGVLVKVDNPEGRLGPDRMADMTARFANGQTSSQMTFGTLDDDAWQHLSTLEFELADDTNTHRRREPYAQTVRIRDNDTAPSAVPSLVATPGYRSVRLRWTEPHDGGGGQPIAKYQVRHAQGSSVPDGTVWTDVPGGADGTAYTFANLTPGVEHAFEVRAVNAAGRSSSLWGDPDTGVVSTPLEGFAVAFAGAAYEDDEDGAVSVEVTLGEAPAAGASVTVPIVATPGAGLEASEYAVPQSVVFAAGEDSKSFTVDFRGDTDDEPDETLTLAIGTLPVGYVAGAPSRTVLTLRDDDDPFVTASFGAAAAEAAEGGAVEVVVSLDRTPEREVALPIRASGLAAQDYRGVPESVRFGAEDTEARFTVLFEDDALRESTERLTLSFGTRPHRVQSGTPARMVVTVRDDDARAAAPEGLVVSVGSGFAVLDWLAVANDSPVTRYEVRWRETVGRGFNAWQRVGLDTTRRVDGLTNGTGYTFEVRAVNGHGAGASARIEATPAEQATEVPAAVQGLEVKSEDSSRAMLVWLTPANAWDPVKSASKLQGYRVEVCRASCNEEKGWYTVVANTRRPATQWVHEVLAPGVIRENRYRVRAIDVNGRHGAWSNVATLPPTVVADNVEARALDPETVETRFRVDFSPDGHAFHVRLRASGGTGAWAVQTFALLRTGEYEHEFGDLEPSTSYRVEFDFSADFDSPWKKTSFETTPPAGTGSTVGPRPPRPEEPVRVEIDVDGDGVADGAGRFALAMGGKATYRLRLAAAENDCRGPYQARAEVVRYGGVGTQGGHPALMRYAQDREWAVLECGEVTEVRAPAGSDPGQYRTGAGPWTEVELEAPAFAEHVIVRRERVDLLLGGPWTIAWRHALYKDEHAAQAGSGLSASARRAEWQAAVDATVTAPRTFPAPNGLVTSDVSGEPGALRLDWQPVAGAAGYELQWRFGADPYDPDPRHSGSYRKARVPSSVERPMTIDVGADATRRFTARVRAYSDEDASPWSVETVRPGSSPTLSVADAQAFEENARAGFRVTLSEVAAEEVTVRYATANGTARAPADYLTANGALTFAPYETEKTVWVDIVDDAVEDSEETFTLRLSGARGGGVAIADGVATGTILNSDGPNADPTGLPAIAGTARVGEALTASVDGITDTDGLADAVFAYRWVSSDGTSDSDIEEADEAAYTPVEADVGRTLKVRVTFTDDGGTEETLTSAATAPVAAALAEVAVRAVSGHVAEGAAAAFALSRTGDVSAALAVDVEVTAESVALDGAAPSSVAFAPGAEEATLTVATVDDAIVGADGTVTLRLTAGTGYEVSAGGAEASVTVLDDDVAPPAVSVRAVSGHVAEGAAAAFALSRTGDVTAALAVAVEVTADGVTLDGAAPSSVELAPGAEEVTLTVATADDESPGADGTVTLRLAAGAGYEVAAGGAEATVAVLDDDAAPAPPAPEETLWSGTATVTGSGRIGSFSNVAGTGGFEVRSIWYSRATERVSLRLSSGLPADGGLTLHLGGHAVAFPAGSGGRSSVKFEVGALAWVEGEEVSVRITRPSAGALSSDAALAALGLGGAALAPAFEADRLVYAAAVGSSVSSVTVTAAPRGGDADVAFEPADADGGAPGHQVALRVGETLVTARVTAADGETVRSYRVVVTRPGAVVTVAFGAAAYTAVEGGAGAEVAVRLSGDPGQDVTIALTATPGGGAEAADYTAPASVTFTAGGALTQTALVTAVADEAAEAGESVALAFGELPEGVVAGATAQATVALADAGPVAAVLSVGGAGSQAGRFQVRAAFAQAVTGFAADDLEALRVGGDAASVSDVSEAETGRAWTAWVAAPEAGRYVVRLGAGAAQSGDRESAAAVLVADVDAEGNAVAVAGPAVSAVTVAAPGGGALFWGPGDDIEVTLGFTEAVTVDTAGGTPTVGLTVGGTARTAPYASGTGTASLTFAYAVRAQDGTVSAVEVTASSLAVNGATIRDGAGRAADLAHPGASRGLAGEPEAPAEPLLGFTLVDAASATDVGSIADGGAFTLDDPANGSYGIRVETAEGAQVGSVKLALVAGAKAVTRTDNLAPWSLYGDANGAVHGQGLPAGSYTLTATAHAQAGATGAVLQTLAVSFTVTAAETPAGDALTAAFRDVPESHGGPGSEPFTFRVLFSEAIPTSYRVLRDQGAFTVVNGTVKKARRVDGRDDLREIHIQPSGWDAVTVTLPATTSCAATGAICMGDERMLSNTETATVEGPVAIDVADAKVTEGPGATLDFVVSLSRASDATVTVDYATADGTATEGEDYTRTDGTLTFEAGVTSKTVSVPVLDDAHDDDGETMTLVLSNAVGARIRDGEAVGTIENSDAIPKAWLARFGRTVADHVVDAVGSRLAGPAQGGSHVTLGGQRIALDGGGAPAGADAAAERGLAGREAREGLAALADRMAGASHDGAPGAGGWTLREEDGGDGTRTMTGRELLLGSSFHLGLGADGESAGAADTRWTAWGRAAASRFDGEADGLVLDGEVTTFTLGADAAWSRWLAGVAVSLSEGEGSYRDHERSDHASRGSGKLESSLTGVHPYARLTLSERLSAWGLLGFGTGELTLEVDSGERWTTDTATRWRRRARGACWWRRPRRVGWSLRCAPTRWCSGCVPMRRRARPAAGSPRRTRRPAGCG